MYNPCCFCGPPYFLACPDWPPEFLLGWPRNKVGWPPQPSGFSHLLGNASLLLMPASLVSEFSLGLCDCCSDGTSSRVRFFNLFSAAF